MRVASIGILVALGGCDGSPASRPPICPGGAASCVDLRIVAHQDDDLLFDNPDLQTSISQGNDVTTVYVTAGTYNDPARLSVREVGILNAYSYMVDPSLAVTDASDQAAMLASWTLHDNSPIEVATTAGPRHVVQYDFASGHLSVVFTRIVERNSIADLSALWDGRAATIPSVACSTGCVLGSASAAEDYDGRTLVELLEALMTRFEDPSRPFAVRTLDATGLFSLGDGYSEPWVDNSDHVASAQYAVFAFANHPAGDNARSLVQYRGYDIREEAENLGDDALEKRRAFYRYYVIGEDPSYTNLDPDDPHFTLRTYEDWTKREYAVRSASGEGTLRVGERCLVASGGTLSLGACNGATMWRTTVGFQLQATDGSACVDIADNGTATAAACAPTSGQTLVFTSTGQIRTRGALCLHGDDSGIRAMPCDKRVGEDGYPEEKPIIEQAWRWTD